MPLIMAPLSARAAAIKRSNAFSLLPHDFSIALCSALRVVELVVVSGQVSSPRFDFGCGISAWLVGPLET